MDRDEYALGEVIAYDKAMADSMSGCEVRPFPGDGEKNGGTVEEVWKNNDQLMATIFTWEDSPRVRAGNKARGS